jgi:hypothetical protein
MPARNAYPLCCGASIFTGFEDDPEKVSGYEAINYYNEARTKQVVFLGYGVENGKIVQVPPDFYSWTAAKQIEWTKQHHRANLYGYYNIETGKKVGDESGYALDEHGNRIPKIAINALKQELEVHRQSYPTHFYSCILTDRQIKKHPRWLAVLKEMGFEFKLSFMNAVHNERERLYFFSLVTDDKGKCKGDFNVPPPGWNDLPNVEEPILFQKVEDAVPKRRKAA